MLSRSSGKRRDFPETSGGATTDIAEFRTTADHVSRPPADRPARTGHRAARADYFDFFEVGALLPSFRLAGLLGSVAAFLLLGIAGFEWKVTPIVA